MRFSASAVCLTLLVASGLAVCAARASESRDGLLTPREVIVRLDNDDHPTASRAFASFDREWGILSAEPIVAPRLTATGLRRQLQRTWTIRYRRNAPASDAAAAIAALPGAQWTQPNRLFGLCDDASLNANFVPNDPKYAEQWNIPIVDLPKAWGVERGSASVVVATVDTGAALAHPDLRDQLWTNAGEIPDNGVDDDGNGFVDDTLGWDFVDAVNAGGKGDYSKRDNDPTDETGHGTHVAGIISARPNNDIAVAGVAWNCRLMVVRAGYASRDGGTFLQEDDSASAILYAVENGASVVNLSWGDEQGSFLLRDVVRYAHERDVVLVGATGNDSRKSVVFPAAYPEVISVAASDQNDDAAYFTNGHAGVDIAAPGMVILSLDIDDGMRSLSGTSMAAPHVAGIVALMRSKRRALNVEAIRAILKATADPLRSDGRLVGVGRVNAYRSVLASSTATANIVVSAPKLAADTTLVVEGVVAGADVSGYRLLFGESESPTAWSPLFSVYERSRRGALGTWHTSAVAEGVYTIRLEAFDASGRAMARDQAIVNVDHSPPRVLRHAVLSALVDGGAAPVLWFETDDDVAVALRAERLDARAEPMTLRFAGAKRRVVLGAQIAREGRWRYTLSAVNGIGKAIEARGEFDAGGASPNPAAMTRFGDRHPPSLDMARRSADFDGDGAREIIGATPGSGGFRATQIYEFDAAGRYRAVHAFRDPISPLDVGDSDGDGKPEALGLAGAALVVLESPVDGGFPTQEIARFEGIRTARFSDVTGDGRPEIVARRDASRVVVIVADGDDRFRELPSIENPTEGRNHLADSVAFSDLDNDGAAEIIVADSEGEVIAFRYEGGSFAVVGAFASRFRNAKALDSGVFDGRRGIALIADDVYDRSVPRATLQTVSLLIWNESRRTFEEVAALPVLASDELPSVTVGRTALSASDTIAVLLAGGLYALRFEAGRLALTWASPASPTRFAMTDVSGDGLAELLYSNQGTLSIVSNAPSLDAATIPFAVTARALDSSRVQLTWRAETPSEVGIYRSENGETSIRVATVAGATEYVDATVRKVSRYLYEVAAGENRSRSVSVFVGDQPKMHSAEALSPRRVSVMFSLPMSSDAREPRRYAARHANGRVVQPSSVVTFRDESRECVLSFDDALENGEWTLEALTPDEVTSRDAMPLDDRFASTTFIVLFEKAAATTLRDLRVYPNPIYPARNHVAEIAFDRLPVDAGIRVFDASGSLVAQGRTASDGRWVWNLANDASRPVVSGVYLYTVESASERRTGKVAVVR